MNSAASHGRRATWIAVALVVLGLTAVPPGRAGEDDDREAALVDLETRLTGATTQLLKRAQRPDGMAPGLRVTAVSARPDVLYQDSALRVLDWPAGEVVLTGAEALDELRRLLRPMADPLTVQWHAFQGELTADGSVVLLGRWFVADAHHALDWRGALVFREGRVEGLHATRVRTALYAGGTFTDVTSERVRDEGLRVQFAGGMNRWRKSLDRRLSPEPAAGGHLLAADADGDGRVDLFLGQPGGLPNRLLITGPTGLLEDRSRESHLDLLELTLDSFFGDLDGDGRTDAVLVGDGIHLFRGTGGGAFVAVDSVAVTAAEEPGAVYTSVSAADLDADGDRDLLITASASELRPEGKNSGPSPLTDARNGARNLVLRNVSRLAQLELEVAPETGLWGNDRWTRAACVTDLDGDGWPDVYLANDHGLDQLFRGREEGFFTFEPGGVSAWPPSRSRWVQRGDFNGDGAPDLLVGTLSAPLGATLMTLEPEHFERVSSRTRGDLLSQARGGALLLSRGERGFDRLDGPALGVYGDAVAGAAIPCFGDGADEVLLLTAAPARAKRLHGWRHALPTLARETTQRTDPLPYSPPGWEEESTGPAQLLFRLPDGSWFDLGPFVLGEALTGGTAVAALDVDGDQDLDVVALCGPAPGLRVLRNDLSGSPGVARGPSPAPEAPRLVVLAPPVPAPLLELPEGNLLGGAIVRPLVLYVGPSPEETRARWRDAVGADHAWEALSADALDPDRAAVLGVLLGFCLADPLPLESGTTFLFDRDGGLARILQGGAAPEVLRVDPPLTAGYWRRSRDPDLAGLMRRYLRAGQPMQAYRLGVREAAPADPVLLETGRALLALQRGEEALAVLRDTAGDPRATAEATVALTTLLRRSRQPARALAAVDAYLARDAADADVRFERGLSLLQMNRTEEALEELELAAALVPERLTFQRTLGEQLLQAGYLEVAERHLQAAARLAPGSQEVWLLRALAEVRRVRGLLAESPGDPGGRTEEPARRARQHFETARACAGDPGRLFFEWSAFELDLGEFARARELARESERCDPGRAAVQQLLRSIEEKAEAHGQRDGP